MNRYSDYCSGCGTTNPDTDEDGYSECCNEPITDEKPAR